MTITRTSGEGPAATLDSICDFGGTARVGWYGAGSVLSTVPSQQYLAKHCWHCAGTVVPVLSKLLLMIAQPTQAGQEGSSVAFARVATLYPFWTIAFRVELL